MTDTTTGPPAPGADPRPSLEAYFVRDGDDLVPTGYCRGPWDPATMHGGPPSALLVAEALRAHPRKDARLARATVEILRPVPLARVQVTSAVERRGRKVELLSASLVADGIEVLRARLWRVRTDAALPLPAQVTAPVPPVQGPQDGPAPPFLVGSDQLHYGDSLQAYFVHGSWQGTGPAAVWLRMRVPLVAGEPVAPHTRVLVVADSGNGASAVVDFTRWLFVNPELTVHLLREPVGEWVLLDASTQLSADGVGLATSRLSDETGVIGRGAQSLFIDQRS